jgi:hypothetical protein
MKISGRSGKQQDWNFWTVSEQRKTPSDLFSCPTLPFLAYLSFTAQLPLEELVLLVSVELRP